MKNHKIFEMSVSDVYPHYVNKVEKKGHSQDDLHRIMTWLTGYTVEQVMQRLDAGDSFRMFFENAPNLNEKRRAITGVICGVRVEEIKDPLMQEIRYLDKLVDELAKGKKMSSILRE